MTSSQEALERMSLSCSLFLSANTAITATLPGFQVYFGIIQTTHSQIYTTKTMQESNRTGDTLSKNIQRAALLAQAMDISRRVVAYASNVGNTSLLGVMDYPESKLSRFSDLKLVTSCQVIRDNANSNVSALAPYGVTAALLTAFQSAITAFNTAIQKTRIVVTNSGEATVTIAVLLQTLKTNWAKIDTLVEMVKVSNLSFYDEYHKLRKVLPLGRNTLAMKVLVINAETGKPEANVTLTLTFADNVLKSASASKKKDIVKKTAAGGGCNYKNLAVGRYMLTARKQGMKEVTMPVDIVGGEMTVVEIRMEKAY